MSHIRTLLAAGALCAAIAGSAIAQETTARQIPLAGLVASSGIGGRMQAGVSPLANMSIRGGAMVTPRGAGLAGIDFDVPSVSLNNGMRGRIDADVLFKANFHGINTAIPITFDQISYTPGAPGGHTIYYGAGVGAVLGGHATFDGKLIFGTELAKKFGAEVNVHFTEHDTLLCLLARIHL